MSSGDWGEQKKPEPGMLGIWRKARELPIFTEGATSTSERRTALLHERTVYWYNAHLAMNRHKQPIVLGVDLDGVCANFYARMREIAAEWFEKEIDELPLEVSYGLAEWGITSRDEYASLHRFAVTQRDLFETMPMIEGARSVLRQLSGEGCRIRIITHRLFIHYFHETAVRQTIAWLDDHGIPYWDLCFMKEKDQVGADIYIEDSPENVEKLRHQGHYAICFANSTNTHLGEPKAGSWAEVYDLVRAWRSSL